jgi:outer membrane protein assembly factor BamB
MSERHTSLGKFAHSLSKHWGLMALSALTLVLILAGVFNALPRQQATRAAPSSGDWLTYMNGNSRQGFNGAETVINATSAPNLKQHWTSQAGGNIFAQPVVANGTIYWGSLDGWEHATDLNGGMVWQQFLGARTTCSPLPSLGVVSTATVASVSINGTLTSVVFVGGGDDHFYAVNAASGAIIWSTALGDTSTNTFIWDSPLVYNNSIYIGTATTGEPQCKVVPATLYKLDAASGSIQNTFTTTPAGCNGAGIWTSPALDTQDGSIYFTTGTQGSFTACKEPYAIALVKVRATDLTVIDSWQIPTSQRGKDSDWGASPTLFQANIGGVMRQLVGAVDKNGIYYTFDRTSLKSGPLWTATIAVGGECPQCGNGSISSSAWNGTTLFVAGGNTTIKGKTCKGSFRALDPATGAFKYERCLKNGPVIGALTAVPGVAALVAGPDLLLIGTVTGQTLFKSTGSGITFYGSPSISNGVLYIGSKNTALYAYGI